jgi:long-chain acyl-CoA synthetase
LFAFNTLKDIPSYIVNNVSNNTFLNYLQNEQWHHINENEFVENIYKLSHAFEQAGVGKGSTVAIVSNSSPYWLMIDYALQDIGAISVPIFANIAKENFIYQLKDAEVEYIYIASQDRYEQIKEPINELKLVITHNIECKNDNSVDFNSFINISEKRSENIVNENDIATIIYTSGSTGTPKGVELTHKNIVSQIKETLKLFLLSKDDVALSFLPLAHIFERIVMNSYVTSGVSVYFVNDVKNIANLLKDVKPSIMSVVPRLLDKIYIKIHDNIKTAPLLKRVIAGLALSEADNKELSTTTIFTPIFKKLIYPKLLEALGGNIRFIICGGAPLNLKVEKFFTNIGLEIYQGYGLTETSPVICVNSPMNKKPFTCGKAFSEAEVKIAKDSELYTRGVYLMHGYHNQIEKTNEAIDKDGWFHTGDLASIDKDGFITINGRKKELFKTSNGKYISAIHIEQLLTQNRWCDYAVVVADNKPFVSAFIFLDQTAIKEYANLKRISYSSKQELYNSNLIQKLVKKLVKKANRHLNHEQKVKKYHIVSEEATIDNHILTPSMKISRVAVYARYEDVIKSIYGELL